MYTIIIGFFSSLDYIFLAPTSFDFFFYKFQIWKNLLQLIQVRPERFWAEGPKSEG